MSDVTGRNALDRLERAVNRIRVGGADEGAAIVAIEAMEALALVRAAIQAADAEKLQIGSVKLIVRAADRMADGVAQAVKVGILNSRSEAADALLDYDDLDDHREALGIAPRSALAALRETP